jgi:hypothetical protein
MGRKAMISTACRRILSKNLMISVWFMKGTHNPRPALYRLQGHIGKAVLVQHL